MTSAGHHTMMQGAGTPPPSVMTLNLRETTASALTCNINGLTNVTLCSWVKDLPPWYIMPNWGESGGWGGTYFGTNGGIEVRFGTGSSASKQLFSFSEARTVGWHHYCIVRDTSQSTNNYRLYFDGSLAATVSGSVAALKNNKTTFNIARTFTNSTMTQDTSVVAYGMFSRALSDSEVASVYTNIFIDASKAPFNSGLVLGLNVTEGEGNRIYDLVSGDYIEISSTPNWTVEFNPSLRGGG